MCNRKVEVVTLGVLAVIILYNFLRTIEIKTMLWNKVMRKVAVIQSLEVKGKLCGLNNYNYKLKL